MIRPLQILLVCISAAIIGFLITPLVRAVATRMGLTDRPDSHRKLHGKPIPLGGGVCILFSMWGRWQYCVCSITACEIRYWRIPRSFGILSGCSWPAWRLWCLGLLDDRFVVRGRHKLMGQILVSVLLCYIGYDIQHIRLFGWQIELGLLSVPVTIGWLVLATNSLNLIDGIDGLASTVGILLSVTLASLALLNGHRNEALILASLAGATLGFLPYNFPPARMFLGDAGSMLIGMSLGAVSITGALKGPTVAGLAAPLAIWTIPLFDTFAAIVRRKLTGRSLYMSDRSHLHHCLYQISGSARRTIYLVVLACVGTCIGALASVSLKSDLFAMISAFSVIGVLIATRTFGYGEMQLLATNLRRFTQWILPLRPQLPPQRRTVHLQGSRHWEALWDSLMDFTGEFNLTRMRLDVNIPSVHEDYHAAWVRPSYDDRSPQWQTEIPLRRGDQPLGQLVVAGLHDGFSACGQIAKFMDALRDFERRFEETIADTVSVAKPIPDTAQPAAEVKQGDPILSGPGG